MWVYLTNRDCLSPVKGMVQHLHLCDEVDEIVIVDCGSTYPKLLEWYKSCPVRVVRCENIGPYAPWKVMQDTGKYYAVSDADLDISNVPTDFITKLRLGLEEHPENIKTGLSLTINDLPFDFPFRDAVIKHESQFWTQPVDVNWYSAAIDTTFAVYQQRTWSGYSPSLRSTPPYIAKHLPWYLSEQTMSEEWLWYFKRCESNTHWSSQFRNILSSGKRC